MWASRDELSKQGCECKTYLQIKQPAAATASSDGPYCEPVSPPPLPAALARTASLRAAAASGGRRC